MNDDDALLEVAARLPEQRRARAHDDRAAARRGRRARARSTGSSSPPSSRSCARAARGSRSWPSAGNARRAAGARAASTTSAQYLSACQFGITLASLGIGFLGEPAIAELLEPLFGDALSHGVSRRDLGRDRLRARPRRCTSPSASRCRRSTRSSRPSRSRVRVARPLQLVRRASCARSSPCSTAASNGILRLLGIDAEAELEEGGDARGAASVLIAAGAAPAASSTRARPGCSPASSTCTSRRRAR